jgi:hypothetical protein
MTIIVYTDVIVPSNVIQAGAAGKSTRQNIRTVNQGGFASVNAIRDETLRQYTFGFKPMDLTSWAQMEALYEVTDAGTYGMLLLDPKDSVVTSAQGALIGYMAGVENGVYGFGNGTPLYGLRKLYTSGSRAKARPITRPNGTPALLRNGAAVTVGAGAGNVALSALSAGPVYATFVADSSANVSAVTVGATTVVTLASALAGLAVGGKLWLQGLTGTDAPLLNNLAHTITNIAGAVYTLSTNTAGKTIAAAGQGQKYPQPTDTLTWSGTFYVPVQFANDDMDWQMEKPGAQSDRLVSGPSIPLAEIREA